jgi:hypothetical protein
MCASPKISTWSRGAACQHSASAAVMPITKCSIVIEGMMGVTVQRSACAAATARGVLNSWRWLARCSSVADLNARPKPNAAIAIPNRCASGPVACRLDIHGCRRDVDGGWCIVAGAARNRGSKQCTNRQSTENAGGYVTTSCNCDPWRGYQTNAACDEQSD